MDYGLQVHAYMPIINTCVSTLLYRAAAAHSIPLHCSWCFCCSTKPHRPRWCWCAGCGEGSWPFLCMCTMAITYNECILYYVNCNNTSAHVWCAVSTNEGMYQVVAMQLNNLCCIQDFHLFSVQYPFFTAHSLARCKARSIKRPQVQSVASDNHRFYEVLYTWLLTHILCMYLHWLCNKRFSHPLERWPCFMPHCPPNHGGEWGGGGGGEGGRNTAWGPLDSLWWWWCLWGTVVNREGTYSSDERNYYYVWQSEVCVQALCPRMKPVAKWWYCNLECSLPSVTLNHLGQADLAMCWRQLGVVKLGVWMWQWRSFMRELRRRNGSSSSRRLLSWSSLTTLMWLKLKELQLTVYQILRVKRQ